MMGQIPVAQINMGEGGGEPKVKFIGNGKVSPSSTGKSGGEVKKSSTKKKSDEIERYHTVNKEMDAVQRKMDRAAGSKDAVFGKNKLSYIQK